MLGHEDGLGARPAVAVAFVAARGDDDPVSSDGHFGNIPTGGSPSPIGTTTALPAQAAEITHYQR